VELSDALQALVKKQLPTIADVSAAIFVSSDDVTKTTADAEALVTGLGYTCTTLAAGDKAANILVGCTAAGKLDVLYQVSANDGNPPPSDSQGLPAADITKLTTALQGKKAIVQIVKGTDVIKTLSAAVTGTTTVAAATTTVGATPAAGKGGTLIVGTVFFSKNLDPGLEYTQTAFTVFHSTYQTLVTYKNGDVTTVVPDLATSWKVSADGKTYTFKLDPTAKFATGKAVTASDVVFSYKRLQNLKGQPAFVTANMTDFAAPDPSTVVITLKDIDPATLSLLTTPSFGVLDSNTAKANGATDAADADKSDTSLTFFNSQSIGSGPYVLTSYKPDSEIDLAKNPNYNGTVSYDKIIIKNQPDVNVQQASLEKGDIDFALDLGADQAKALTGKSGVVVKQITSLTVFFVLMNADAAVSAPTSKPEVRQAIRDTLNYTDYLDLGGTGSVQPPSVIPIGLAGALEKGTGVTTDLAKAKDLLTQAGYKDGFPIKMSYPSDLSQNGVKFETMAQKVQADLAQVGIAVDLVPMTTQVWLDAYRGGKEAMTLSLWAPDYNDPSDYQTFFPGQKIALRGGWKAGSDQALEDLAKKAAVELDQNTRVGYYQQAQKLLNQDGPYAPFLQPSQVVGLRSNITGYVFSPVWVVDFNSTSKQ
jgi:peptide/nickel transport system substrate-binding protein